MSPMNRRNVLKAAMAVPIGLGLTSQARAGTLVKLTNFRGLIDVTAENPVPFFLVGSTPRIGDFTAHGEVNFSPNEEEGSLVGEGVVVLKAANGDVLVGVTSWDVDPAGGDFRGANFQMTWRDEVTLSDGREVTNTGRFARSRPQGLVVIAIIAILIGMLLPAVQKVR